MRSLSNTMSRLAAMRAAAAARPGTVPDRLVDMTGFGANPGGLTARCYVPTGLPAEAPLVVVLHGCTQDAAGYDYGSGWSQLADERGFAVLYPEQQRANNANLCFNWFNPEDTRRDGGEAHSIRQMIATMVDRHALDPSRVYITGLSAGGAMTSVMLATYPEIFAGGAIIAGLPYGTASSVPQAFDRMRAQGGPVSEMLGSLVMAASDHQGDWPIVSVWHGASDATVSPANAELVVSQWRTLHGLGNAPTRVEQTAAHTRRIWCDAAGRAVIEENRIAGMGHGTPIHGTGPDACGVAGPYMLETAVSSTRSIAAFWGLTEPGESLAHERDAAPAPGKPRPVAVDGNNSAYRHDRTRAADPVPAAGPGSVIEAALRAAGLMR